MFPFDQPGPTAFYLVLYLGTLVLHVVPMNYVLAGSTYLALLSAWEVVRGRTGAAHQAIAASLRDWLPFALSVAITAGVAPLLFLQVLYKEPFYTANLLLFHRWMAILPVLIVAFYLLYVQKSKTFPNRPAWLRAVVTIGIWLCFGFVAWSWTENHLLSTRGLAYWTEHYASGSLFYGDAELAARLAVWWLGALPTLALILAWQLRGDERVAGVLARIALVSMAAAGVAAVVYLLQVPTEARALILSSGLVYLVVTILGGIAEAALWYLAIRKGGFTPPLLCGLTAASLAAITGATVLRELRRVASLDLSQYYAQHASAGEVSGWAAFVFFLLLNTLLIGWVVWLVRPRGESTAAS